MNSDAAKKERKGERNLSVGGAALILLVVFATIILTIRAGVGTNMALLLGAFEAMIACLLLRKPWQDVQNPIIEFMSGTLVVIIILIDVGVMVGAWIIGGTVPSLMYYGLKLITPALVVPMAFLLCAVMSIFTGTSFGSIATMGIAVTGVAIGIGVPMPLVAGAVVAGAHVGDKMSPMSDSTNLCSGVTGVDLYEHIGAMMHTTVPAAIISLVIYFIMGMKYAQVRQRRKCPAEASHLSTELRYQYLCSAAGSPHDCHRGLKNTGGAGSDLLRDLQHFLCGTSAGCEPHGRDADGTEWIYL